MTPTRREFLTDLAVLGGAAALPFGLAAQGRGPRRIDVHDHFAPPTVYRGNALKLVPRLNT